MAEIFQCKKEISNTCLKSFIKIRVNQPEICINCLDKMGKLWKYPEKVKPTGRQKNIWS